MVLIHSRTVSLPVLILLLFVASPSDGAYGDEPLARLSRVPSILVEKDQVGPPVVEVDAPTVPHGPDAADQRLAVRHDVELRPLDPAVTADDVSDSVSAEVIPATYHAPCVQVGQWSVKPYGTLWTDMIYATSRTAPSVFPLWVQSEQSQGEDAFFVEARYSRAGLNIQGPSIDLGSEFTTGGKVEIDFLGGFVNANTSSVRLRHVYWEMKNEEFRILGGQTWDVISPLIPNTVGFPVLWGAGNIGFRRAQFRLERYADLSDRWSTTWQGAVAQNINPDLVDGSAADGVIREEANWPVLEGRAAFRFTPYRCAPITFGFSGHIGETGFDFTQPGPPPLRLPAEDDARFRTWSVNFDIKMPLTERLSFQGEFFSGANLSNQLGGILQGVCPCLRVPIRSMGGWGELTFDVAPRVHTHVGFSIDDPDNADSLVGRTYNQVIYANVFLDCTDSIKTGLEVATWKTLYHNKTLAEPNPADRMAGPTEPGEAVVINWTVRYSF